MRSKDLHMAATIDMESRTIMVSGAIDQNEAGLFMRIQIPEPGPWTIIKSETNLTDQVWDMWMISLGEGIRIPEDSSSNLFLSRQFKQSKYFPEEHAIMFYDGEVRPGDAVIKIMRFIAEGNEIQLSHGTRIDGGIVEPEPTPDEIDDTADSDMQLPPFQPTEMDPVYAQLKRNLALAAKRPKLEVFAAVRIIKERSSDVYIPNAEVNSFAKSIVS